MGGGGVFRSKLWSSQIWSFPKGVGGGFLVWNSRKGLSWEFGQKFTVWGMCTGMCFASQIVSHILRMWRLMWLHNVTSLNDKGWSQNRLIMQPNYYMIYLNLLQFRFTKTAELGCPFLWVEIWDHILIKTIVDPGFGQHRQLRSYSHRQKTEAKAKKINETRKQSKKNWYT